MLLQKITGLLVLIIFSTCNKKVERIQPIYQKMTEAVYASVTIQPQDLYLAYPKANGVIEELLVEEGMVVNKGQVIARITSTNPQIQAENAALNVELIKNNLEGKAALPLEIKDELESAQLQLSADSLRYDRQKNLWERQVGSEQEYDNRKLAYELAVKRLQSLQRKYARSQKELNTQLKLAQNNLKASKVTKNDFKIIATKTGKVYALYKEAGEGISIQEPLASIGCQDNFLIELEVDEVDIAQIQQEQIAWLTLDAYGEEVFEARVTKIYPQKNTTTQTFKIECEFIHPPAVLYPGLSGEASIVIREREGVITVPKDYLVNNRNVRTEEGLIEVEVGLQNMEWVEVISGIDTSTYLLKPEL